MTKNNSGKIVRHPSRARALKTEHVAKGSKAEQDELLTEALMESFPASDPISSMRFTSL